MVSQCNFKLSGRVNLPNLKGQGIPEIYGAVEEAITELVGLPKKFDFGNAYPNPFNPTTKFDFALPQPADVNIEVFNVLGQKVATLKNSERMNAGYHSLSFDGDNLSSGVYLINARLGDKYRRVQKIILFK